VATNIRHLTKYLGLLDREVDASQSFEMLGIAFTVTEHRITLDVICSSTSQNLKYHRRISAYAEITAWAVAVLE
jgi:hypothetical protein